LDTADHPGSGENRRAVEVTLGELQRMGRLEKIDAARVQALRSMADALDHKPDSPQMWREYLGALEELIAADEGDIEELLTGLRGEVRHAEED
jgi:hypothetical protein